MRPWLALTLLLVAVPMGARAGQEIVTDVWIHDVPGPPGGGFWDPAAENLLSTFTNPASVYPDVMICARPATVAAPHCAKICWNLKGDSHGDPKQRSTECQQPLHVPLAEGDPRMVLEVLEMDPDGDRARVHAIIARNVLVSDPAGCTESRPCRWSSRTGSLVLSFGTEFHGVLGTPAPPGSSSPPAQSGTGTPFTSSPLWQRAVSGAQKAKEGVKKVAQRYAESKDPTAFSRDTTQRAVAASQAAINSCLSAIADQDETLRARMPLCANTSGKDFEDCMTTKVLSENAYASNQGANCSRQFQDEANTLARSATYVWLKGQVCGIGQWIGLKVCQQ